jgi:hypothetical protein
MHLKRRAIKASFKLTFFSCQAFYQIGTGGNVT